MQTDKCPHPAHRLITWYEQNCRDLPWRHTTDPYAIWLSETMLQQTRVETVIPYYHEFLARFPTIQQLAAADEAEVLKMWQGLGYYSRARNLHKAAKLVVERYGGSIPSEAAFLATLPGIGPYTLGAILSIAFNQPVPAVDGNVLRVMARYLGVDKPIQSQAAKRVVHDAVESWLTETTPAKLTQALMELGALVCIPRNPRCDKCPLQADCEALRIDRVHELPQRTKAKPRRQVTVVALWCEDERGVLLEQRPDAGLLASMWQLPAVELTDEGVDERGRQQAAAVKLAELSCMGGKSECFIKADRVAEANEIEFALVGRDKHIFSHVEWDVFVYRPVSVVGFPRRLKPGYEFAHLDDLEAFALPRVYEKLLESIPAGRNVKGPVRMNG
ncbi:A/G-specific adenine glycosylase [Alicyclobacillus herbarius]|uniref:A/G-specific adenine glycosylase n=1 Tax=Alicyclobacillus herbarius TaxID=122960 RepID=UPI00041BBAB4|nr:A/G-specific adenine glycosylase [Alicyclobacillus herbarius]